ncbi:MAG TPA: hypothetical protein DIC36_04705 [Gammaproteobacteria bacterium]|nr:hypothetical protein [Gammaproteobacteria bacterium]
MANAKPASKILRVLILDDSPDDTEQASSVLRQAGYMLKTQRLETGVAVEQTLDNGQWDLILCAHGVPSLPPRQVVELVVRKKLLIPVIVLARRIQDDDLRTLMQAGARDVVIKGQWGRLVPVVERELATVQDRKSAIEAREALEQLEARYRSMIEASLDAIGYVQDGMHMDANAAYLRLFGFDKLETLKETPLLNLIDKVDQTRFKQALRKPEGTAKPQEFQAVTGSGHRVSVEVVMNPLTIHGEPCVQIVATDISKRKALESKLQSMHQRDALTGLYNRSHFLNVLGDNLKTPGGVLIGLNINHLADLNQRIGHVACDRLLVQLALQLRDAAGSVASLARIAGGQFAVLLDNKTATQGEGLIKKIESLLDSLSTGDNGGSLKSEVILTTLKLDGRQKDRQAIMDQVFKAEVRPIPAKVAAAPAPAPEPKASEPVPVPSINIPSLEITAASAPAPVVHDQHRTMPALGQDWSSALKEALANNTMELAFQPIINLHGDPQPFYEAKFQLRTADDQLIPPDLYMPAAETSGLGGKIDRALMMSVVDTVSKYRLEGRSGTVFVSLSVAAVNDNALLTAMQMHMKATGLRPGDLVLQLNESVFSQHMEAARAFTQKASAIGVSIAIDCFSGQGITLEQLSGIKIDYLGINCGVGGLEEISLYNAIDAAHALEKTIIARNIDEAELFTTLFSRGVHYVQGNYLQPATTGLDYTFEEEQTLASDVPSGPNWRAAG